VRTMSDQSSVLAGKHVLIAEDEPLIAIDYDRMLAEAGAEIVGTCATVTQALDCLDHTVVDVAVVDFLLADRNSEPLQAELKQRHIPFVMVSSYPRALVRTEEGQDVLRKPVMPSVLRGSVAAACRRAA
jgi:two-component SAPR family response regulator